MSRQRENPQLSTCNDLWICKHSRPRPRPRPRSLLLSLSLTLTHTTTTTTTTTHNHTQQSCEAITLGKVSSSSGFAKFTFYLEGLGIQCNTDATIECFRDLFNLHGDLLITSTNTKLGKHASSCCNFAVFFNSIHVFLSFFLSFSLFMRQISPFRETARAVLFTITSSSFQVVRSPSPMMTQAEGLAPSCPMKKCIWT